MGQISLLLWLGALPLPLTAASDPRPIDAQPGVDGKSEPPAPIPTPPLPAPAPAPAAPPAAPAAAAALAWLPRETTSYRVTFGIVGQVAEATLSYAPDFTPAKAGPTSAPWLVRAAGTGSGAVLGFGKTDKHIESEIDMRTLAGRRWTNIKASDGKTTVDTGEQAKSGSVSLVRKRAGEPDLAESFSRTAMILDPMSFLLHVRMALPKAPTTYEILDGRALWIAEVGAAQPDPETPGLLRLDGKVDPIYWNGSPDPQRTSRTFSLFITADNFHTPVLMVVPFGVGEVRAELVRLERPGGEAVKTFVCGLFCRVSPGHRLCRGIDRPWSRPVTFP